MVSSYQGRADTPGKAVLCITWDKRKASGILEGEAGLEPATNRLEPTALAALEADALPLSYSPLEKLAGAVTVKSKGDFSPPAPMEPECHSRPHLASRRASGIGTPGGARTHILPV